MITDTICKSAGMVYSRESVLKRIEKLKEYRSDLQDLGSIDFTQFDRDKKSRYIIERILFLIAESILDILDHILSSKHSIVSDSYEDIITNAYRRRVIETTLYEKLRGLGGFRNVLAHEYITISGDEVYRNYLKVKDMLDDVIETFERLA